MATAETIYSFNPTRSELEEICYRYVELTEAQYLEELARRAQSGRTTVDYERVVDLQELFSMRGDKTRLNHYSHILDVDFSDISGRIFNE